MEDRTNNPCSIEQEVTAKVSEFVNAQAGQQPAGQMLNLKAVEDIVSAAAQMTTAEEQKRQERLALLRGLRVTTQTVVEPEQYALSVDGVGFFALDDIHGLKSKQKAGKTTVFKVCTAALMGGGQFRVKSELTEPTVLWLDTEQKPADVKGIIDDVIRLSGRDAEYIDKYLKLFQLRKMNYETLISDTRLLIEDCSPQVVLIDGVVEFVASFNDEQTSRKLIKDLMMLAEEFHCAIVCVLHENKAVDDQNMRGHLGTVLSQKAGTVLQCQKDATGVITVSCPDSRHGQMPEWSIRFDEQGHIIDADLQRQQRLQAIREEKAAKRKAEQEQMLQQRLDIAQRIISKHGGSILRSELTKTMEQQTHLDRSTVSRFISKMVTDGKLFEASKTITLTAQTACPF